MGLGLKVTEKVTVTHSMEGGGVRNLKVYTKVTVTHREWEGFASFKSYRKNSVYMVTGGGLENSIIERG